MNKLKIWGGGVAAALLLAVMAALPGAIAPEPASAGVPASAFNMSIDCDVNTGGIQLACPGLTAGTFAVDIVVTNNSGGAVQVGAFGYNVLADQAVLTATPVAVCDPSGLNCNPDFNQTAVTGAGWACSPPAPEHDVKVPGSNPAVDANPAVTDSFIGCFNGAADGVTLANGGTLVVGRVSYTSVNGPTAMTFLNGNFYDENFGELGSCNEIISVPMDCPQTNVSFGAGVPTNTPTATTGPATNTPTPTNTTVPPTATFTPTNTTVPPTATFTPTNTTVPPTATFTPTNTNTPTPTNTVVGPTNTNTPTPTNTNTPTPTNTTVPSTATFTPTNTTVPPTNTNTPTPTNTVVGAPTDTPTNTPTNTTVPNTNTPTNTPTNTTVPNTNTPTNTPTNTTVPNTNTPTNTPTNTTVPNTNTPTPTNTAVSTSTNTPTATNTVSATNTPAVTRTVRPTQTVPATRTVVPTRTATATPVPEDCLTLGEKIHLTIGILLRWGAREGQRHYNWRYDLNDDGRINGADLHEVLTAPLCRIPR